MAIGATRVNGSAAAGGFYGYQPLFFSVTNTATTVGTADTVPGGGVAITEGNFSKAVRGIQSVGSIVFIGTRANAGFICAIDSTTANAYVSANTDTDVAAALVAAIEAATGLTDVTVTELAMSFAELA
jgi:hypothetical protein